MGAAAFLVGAVFPTFVASRIILLILWKWDGGLSRAFFANAASLMALTLICGIWLADGGKFNAMVFPLFLLPQSFWLCVDMHIAERARRKATR